MTIEVRCRPFELTPALAARVQRRLRFALGRFAARIDLVRVRLGDDNGPRGGVDKSCRVRAYLRGAGLVRIDELDTDLYTAVDRVAGRLSRVVARAFDRRATERPRRHAAIPGDRSTRQAPATWRRAAPAPAWRAARLGQPAVADRRP